VIEEPATTETGGEGLPEAEFAALLDGIGKGMPLLRGLFGGGECHSPAARRREGLLLALKPYLSSSRCEAIDYLIRIGRLRDTLYVLTGGSAEAANTDKKGV
jgi:hypothetical protein